MVISAKWLGPSSKKDRTAELHIDGQVWITCLPPDARDLRERYEAWIAEGGRPEEYSNPFPDGIPVGPPDYSKAQLFTEMSDAEFDLYEKVSAQQKKRERAIFENTTAIKPQHPLYPKFEQLIMHTYGPTRGPELLAAAAVTP